MKHIIFNILISAFSIITALNAQSQKIDLSGTWSVHLNRDHPEMYDVPDTAKMEGMIRLPSSLAQQGFGMKTIGADFGVLTPEYKYLGVAEYEREITIPTSWTGKEIEILLERVLWESRVFVDGKLMTTQDGLGTNHIHKIGSLAPGRHHLMIQVNNAMIHNIGDKGHGYGEYTQSIWNGIVGKIEMRAHDPVWVQKVRTFPDISSGNLKIEWQVQTDAPVTMNLRYTIESVSSGDEVIKGSVDAEVTPENGKVIHTIPVEGRMEKWSEFNPVVYTLYTRLESNASKDIHETEFGYYEVSHNGTQVLINGQPVFLRGNLDCVHFVLTGYPSCELEDWIEIFQKYKDYGLNHARFHSWCPPEAAFKAANRVGIYLQAEASIWIDWWMSEDMTARGRPEMDTQGHPAGLGKDPPRDSFVVAEMNRVVDIYGNHPSFTMFCIGNELGNGDFSDMKNWIADLKRKDPRHLYAISTARKITEVDDYSVTHYIPGVGRTRGLNGARTDWDFEETYGQMDIPIIAHEIGQWPVYPRWDEIEKYTGVLKARNLQKLKALAGKNGILNQNEDFVRASGALNQILYKYETESFLRTRSCAGIQLLSMQDYQGQGEALIGWLDAHWDSKGITSPEKFREHYNTTVPLLRMKKFVWENNELFKAGAQLSHYGEQPLNSKCTWSITDASRAALALGSFPDNEFQRGTLTDLGEIRYDLSEIKSARRLTVTIEVPGTAFQNSWDIWVYPTATPEPDPVEVFITNELDKTAISKLRNGEKVLLVADHLGTEESSVSAHFYPLYWSLTFFPGQGKTNLGMWIEEDHPVFADFPTSFHSDWQWESISSDARGFMLNDLPEDYRPMAQPVDDFHRSNRVGSIFEMKTGEGKLLVCGYDLNADNPVARQLKQSILKYMTSEDFTPDQEVEFEWLQNLMPQIPEAETADVSEEFEGTLLYVEATRNVKEQNVNIPWDPGQDIVRKAKGTEYNIEADGVWKDDQGAAWHGKTMQISITCPEGMLGTLLVHFADWNKIGRTGILEFEGRKVKLGKHEGGRWVSFHVMREDSNDGKLILETSAATGPNLMITKMVLLEDDH